jgi:hypothetical protein
MSGAALGGEEVTAGQPGLGSRLRSEIVVEYDAGELDAATREHPIVDATGL